MHDRDMDLSDAVGGDAVEGEGEVAAYGVSAVVARRQADRPAQRLSVDRRRKEIRVRGVEIHRACASVAASLELPGGGESRAEPGPGELHAPRLEGRLDVEAAEFESEVGASDDPMLHGLPVHDRNELVSAVCGLRNDPERGLGVKIFRLEGPVQVGGERQPLVVETADRADRHAIGIGVAPYAQHQQAVVSFAQPFDADFRSVPVVEALDPGDRRAAFVHHVECCAVVVRILSQVAARGLLSVCGALDPEAHRPGIRRCGGRPLLGVAGRQKKGCTAQ